ncbi:MAG TPA: glycosyltransferase [Bacteroidia bacterium]|jgi:glycosyltransferase involved in cell wall biosynthesis
MEKKKIVFLYTELATYFLACVEELQKHPALEIHIVRWNVNAEAPFNFSFSSDIFIYNRTDYNDTELTLLIAEIDPSVIYSSGWTDKGYLRVCKRHKKKVPVILGFDNQWKGTLKQYIACLVSPFRILNHFSYCWVPGEPQKRYALKLGFKNENILTGFYCCDYNFFNMQYERNRAFKEMDFPKRFLYVGRYVEHKGIRDLWQAFLELQEESPNGWELWCLGAGDIPKIKHPKIMHFGFVQPGDLADYIRNTGVFILPSHFEPWGVVVHEYVSAGFPVICTGEVGASTAFVQNNLNGYIYSAGNIKELKEVLLKIMNKDNVHLIKMSNESVRKAKVITPQIWAKQIISLL